MSGILQGLLASLQSAVAVVTDPFFNLVTLLLNDNGVNGAQNNTFLDSSSNAFTITRNGNTTQGTFTPFSQTGWSDYLDGSSYLTVASGATSFTGDFTIELWYNPAVVNSDNYFFDSAPTLNTFYVEYYLGNLSFNYSAAQVCPSVAYTLTPGVWYHIAVVRSGSATNNCSLYVNGVRVSQGTKTGTMSIGSGGWTINAAGNGNYKGNGYYSNFRVTNGGALYSGASFTVPTSPLTTTVSSGTVSVLTCQSNRFIDNSANAYTVSLTAGTPSVQAFSPFAPTAAYSASAVGGSGYFGVTTDYLSASLASGQAFGTGDFTVECWLYSTVSNCNLLTPSSATNTWGFITYINQFYWQFNGGNVFGVSAIPLNAWTHLAVSRVSGTLNGYVNGVRVYSAADSNNYSGTPTRLIGPNGGGYAPFYMAGTRIINGTGLYSGTTITVPTAPPTAITNTSLLLNYTNAGIYDSAAKNDLQTVDNAQVSTAQSKWGGSSLRFDGVNDVLFMPTNQNLVLGTGDFTVEMWIYPTSLTNIYQRLISSTNSTYGGPDIGFRIETSANSIEAFVGALNLDPNTPSVTGNAWNHVALVRSGSGTNNVSLYLNGTRISQGTSTTDLTSSIKYIGGYNSSGNSEYYNGYMDDVRITKGYARYSGATITVPSAPFPIQ